MKVIPQDLIRDKIYCVNYIEYVGSAGAKEHFYIAVRQDEMLNFKAALERGNFDAEDYGLILEQGAGSAPDFVREKMKMHYKCDHENAISVKDYKPTEENSPI